MEFWQQLLLGGVALVAVWLFVPVIRQQLGRAPKGSSGDWLGLALPIGLVVLFVMLLIALV